MSGSVKSAQNKQYINGAWVSAVDGLQIPLINPATEEVLAKISFGNEKDAALAIDAASSAFKIWSKTTPYYRAEILKKAADYLRQNLDTIAFDMVLESGKPLLEARGEWTVAANLFEWYAEEGKRAYGKVIPTNRVDKRSSVIYQPMGVIGIITAWNFPAYNPARAWAAALAAGCTVVAKPSESTPLAAYHLVDALVHAGLPAGVLNLLIADAAPVGEAMLNDSRLKKISFTGSTRVGKLLMDGASRTSTKLSLELGGNAPVIIFDDVDVDAIAKAASIARFRNNGQVCVSPQRFYVHKNIYDQFAEAISKYVSTLKVGSGFEDGVNVGPLITSKQRDSVVDLLNKAKAENATVLTGGHVPEHTDKGYFIQPTVVTNLDQTSTLARNEIFGPVLPLLKFEYLEDALAKANDTEYGLAAYAFTNNLKTAIQVSEGLEFGIIGINEWAPHGTELPFGGWKQSGQGHESGSEGLYEYMEKKLISIGSIL
ncbi:NAD-dependent succinate-semialdehyde dehydrogenase [Mucilaginibacter sp. X5P1]|uniref:NAD-dependent succinate-semialdehyde dehydrogenase n=1 Tax=Mucilaginibacter sp. X5P1 TaxID=2723088 RepID=UPI00160F2DA5|nr:NAD-dependent succinate-semialdehyde dehydrogenase [Mucilaginibacter sp. X5P1]MBB6137190.1 succinate-semialdehyde dehydrogenase/glutarate-semialdehyde dehydrogenase [Mucilaginibacter sp. X5P1]